MTPSLERVASDAWAQTRPFSREAAARSAVVAVLERLKKTVDVDTLATNAIRACEVAYAATGTSAGIFTVFVGYVVGVAQEVAA